MMWDMRHFHIQEKNFIYSQKEALRNYIFKNPQERELFARCITGYQYSERDDDIIYLMKNKYYDELSEEYFERNKRRHPVWKSESEYKAFVIQLTGGKLFKVFEDAMKATANYLRTSTDNWVIDDVLVEKIQKELDELEESGIGARTIRVQKEKKRSILKVAKCLQRYSHDMGSECSFVILMASQFYSGFSKPDFSKTNITFPMKSGERVAACGDIVSSLRAKEREGENFFYLFYKRENNADADIDKTEICRRLFMEFLSDL